MTRCCIGHIGIDALCPEFDNSARLLIKPDGQLAILKTGSFRCYSGSSILISIAG